ncbi:uncharacterized protein LOC114544917 isoform X3 [Dendronephthya gigantea]|uniref:uncharacterized protein LOC114544917 isoform X3 n=1 Tax=Dendronephthya gigantea TaxID=151771 RepID=UPI00106C6B0A|nr:uncharacterized protein LOC114544917 isoform X3 [Dendronephthya gigantea]
MTSLTVEAFVLYKGVIMQRRVITIICCNKRYTSGTSKSTCHQETSDVCLNPQNSTRLRSFKFFEQRELLDKPGYCNGSLCSPMYVTSGEKATKKSQL